MTTSSRSRIAIRPVERAVREDVRLGALEDADPDALLHLVDLVPLPLDALDVEPAARSAPSASDR